MNKAIFAIALLLLFVFSVFQTPALAQSGPVAGYAFSEGSGTTTVDSSGNNNTGTLLSGASWTTAGKYGNAISFNGSTGYVSVPDSNSLHIGATGTMEAWVNLSATSRWHGIIAKGNANSNATTNYSIEINSGDGVECGVGNGSTATIVDSTATLTAGTFYHVACTWDGTNVTIYINGVKDQFRAQGLTPASNTSPLYIGQFGGNVDRTSGVIDEVRIYNRALSAAQIQTDMNTPVSSATQTGLTVAPGSFTLTSASATQQLTVTATYSDGSTQNVTSNPATTYLSNNTGVVTVGTTGLVQAAGNGTTSVKASYGGFSATANVTVTLPTQTGLTVVPGSFTLTSASATQQLTVTATYSDGSTQNVSNNPATTYLSNNTGVVTVSTTGLVQAAGNGTTSVKASYGGFSATANATVTLPTQTGLTVAPGSFTLTVGATQQLTVTATYSDGSTQNVTSNSATTYSSNNTTVATVNTTGSVKAAAKGTATIQASYGGFSAQATATVNLAAPGLVAAYNFNEGNGTTVTDASGNGNNGAITGATWTPSGRFGGALSFNGTNSWVTVNDAPTLDLTTGLTLEAWIYPRMPMGWQAAIMKEQTSDLVYALYVNSGVDDPSAVLNINGVDVALLHDAEDTQMPANKWTHLTTTYDGSTLRLYQNGVEVNNIARAGRMPVSSGPLRIGGDSIWGEYFDGLIDEVRIYNRALSPTEIQTDMYTPVSSPALTGLAASPGTFTMPAAGALQQLTVTGTYATGMRQDVTLNAGITYTSSNPAVATVSAIGLVKAVANGTATITSSYGGFSTTTTATISIMTDPTQIGQWSQPVELGVVAVNMILLRSGKVLVYGGPLLSGKNATIFDPATGNTTAVPNNLTDIFCSGHAALADGRLLVVGGYDSVNNIVGVADANIFDPATQKWTSLPKMAYRRWYPTATTLPDGRVLVTSGATTCFGYDCLADTPEIYDPATNLWTQLNNAHLPLWYYPYSFLLPDGRVLVAGTSEQPSVTRALDVGAQSWTTIDPLVVEGGSATMYSPGKIMKSGTSADAGNTNIPAGNATYVLDMTQQSTAWQQTASMAAPRAYHNLTVLPDGNVLATGGELTLDGSSISQAVYQAEMWSPALQTWTTLSLEQVPRLYHSTAVLMPDGRVFVAGGGSAYPAPDETTGEYYSPPYLFKGPRPMIASAPTTIPYGTQFVVQSPDATNIASISLVRLGAATHQFNQDARFLSLSFQKSGSALTVRAPVNAKLAPPGYYLLFLVNNNGVPSIASFVKVQ